MVYMSSDLSTSYWNDAVEILPASIRPKGIYSRPKILYHEPARVFVLWVRWTPPDGVGSHVLVAQGSLPVGDPSPADWKVLTEKAPLGFDKPGDFSLWIDISPSRLGYIVYAREGGLVVERLDVGYQASAGASTPAERSQLIEFPGGATPSSPAMFSYKGNYYVAAGGPCCYCKEGTDTHVWIASAPLGPYSPAGTLGTLHHSQLDFIFTHDDVDGVVYSGSRWGVGWGGLDETPVFWGAIDFYRGSLEIAAPVPRPLVWHDGFDLVVSTP